MVLSSVAVLEADTLPRLEDASPSWRWNIRKWN